MTTAAIAGNDWTVSLTDVIWTNENGAAPRVAPFSGSRELADGRLLHPCRDVDWLRRTQGQRIRPDRLSLSRSHCSPPVGTATLLLFCPARDVRQASMSSVGSRASRSSSFARWYRVRAVEAGMPIARAASVIVNPSQ